MTPDEWPDVLIAAQADALACGCDESGPCGRHAPTPREASDAATRRRVARRRLLLDAYGRRGAPSLR